MRAAMIGPHINIPLYVRWVPTSLFICPTA